MLDSFLDPKLPVILVTNDRFFLVPKDKIFLVLDNRLFWVPFIDLLWVYSDTVGLFLAPNDRFFTVSQKCVLDFPWFSKLEWIIFSKIFKTKLFTLSLSKNVSRNPLTGFKNNIFTIFLPLPRRYGGIFLGSNSSSAQIFLSPGGGSGIFRRQLEPHLGVSICEALNTHWGEGRGLFKGIV